MPAVEASASAPVTEEGLHRGLNQRQLTMIAIGSAIGVGLFLGSTFTIGLAGPAVILTYVLGAIIALIMAYALAEMAVVHPTAGSFGVYAERCMLFIWIVILLTYLRFRASLSPQQVSALPIRLPAHRLAAVFGIVMLVGIAVTTFFVDGLRYTVPSFLPFLVVISFVYARRHPRRRAP